MLQTAGSFLKAVANSGVPVRFPKKTSQPSAKVVGKYAGLPCSTCFLRLEVRMWLPTSICLRPLEKHSSDEFPLKPTGEEKKHSAHGSPLYKNQTFTSPRQSVKSTKYHVLNQRVLMASPPPKPPSYRIWSSRVPAPSAAPFQAAVQPSEAHLVSAEGTLGLKGGFKKSPRNTGKNGAGPVFLATSMSYLNMGPPLSFFWLQNEQQQTNANNGGGSNLQYWTETAG